MAKRDPHLGLILRPVDGLAQQSAETRVKRVALGGPIEANQGKFPVEFIPYGLIDHSRCASLIPWVD